MSWSRFPFTVAVAAVTQSIDGATKLRANPTLGSSTNYAVDIQPMTPEMAYEQYGVELDNPAKLFTATANAAAFVQGARVTQTKGGQTYIYEVVNCDTRAAHSDSNVDYHIAILRRLDA
jgi:hypothetical protein